MIYVGIDVAKHKHDCVIMNSDGELLEDDFQIENNLEGFNSLRTLILKHVKNNDLSKLKVGLEATGHYSNNIINFLSENNFPTVIFNHFLLTFTVKHIRLGKQKLIKLMPVILLLCYFPIIQEPTHLYHTR